jgi:hypothetical protein
MPAPRRPPDLPKQALRGMAVEARPIEDVATGHAQALVAWDTSR